MASSPTICSLYNARSQGVPSINAHCIVQNLINIALGTALKPAALPGKNPGVLNIYNIESTTNTMY
jgi:hypothetical protein